MQAAEVAHKIGGAKQVSSCEWKALCPCHNDHDPSLSVSDKGRKVLIYCPVCQAGAKDVIEKVSGLSMSDLFSEAQQQIVAVYDYRDEKGLLLFEVCRIEP